MKHLSRQVKSLWGKKKSANDDKNEYWLPLIVHLLDTKAVINYLYQHWLDNGQRAILTEKMSEDDVHKLVNFLGSCHDFGKATPVFQTKSSYAHNDDLDSKIMEKLIRNGFKDLDSAQFLYRSDSPHNIAGEVLLEDYGLNESVGAIIGGHHGKPNESVPYEELVDHPENYFQVESENNEKDKRIAENWKNIQKELLNWILDLCGYDDIKNVPKVGQPQAVILEGLLIMADWLASSEYLDSSNQIELFPLIDIDKSYDDVFNDEKLKERHKIGIENWQQNSHWNPEMVIDPEQLYKKRWNYHPREVQAKMSQAIQNIIDPGMIIVESPMGVGKTEIALAAVEQLAFMNGRNGLYFALPTQATSNAMFKRVEEWLNKIAKEQGRDLQLNLMHGKAQFNKEYTAIPHAEDVEAEDKDGTVVVNSWFSGKKSILSEFTVGTIDNLLFMGLKQRHLFLKHLGMSGKIVVIDEIHAYDIYMTSYLEKVLEWLGAYHVPVIALSATLPANKRADLIKAYAKGKYRKAKLKVPKNWETTQAYPLLTYLDGQELKQIKDFGPSNYKQNVQVIRTNMNNNELIESAIEKIKNGGVAGIIVNTVKRAQELAKLVPKDIPKMVLHSAFLANDRENAERKLQSLIGKDGKRPEKMIVIGTQVLEQSLDIDFDILFTDIAPIDLILQRIGRLHRHDIKRPADLENPQVYIMGINSFGDYGEANEAIYEKYLLMKTDYYLPDKIQIPDDISPLVQKVYDEHTDDEVEGIEEVKNDFKNKQRKLQRKAKVFQITAPKPKRTIHNWLGNEPVGLDKNEAKAQATVRDIKETVEIILLKRINNEYCLLNGKPVSDDREIAEQVIRLPSAITLSDVNKVIDKLETITSGQHSDWRESEWLKGSLSLTLDKDNNVDFNGWKLHYSSEYGLEHEKEDEDE